MRVSVLFLVSLVLLVSSCVSVNSTKLSSKTYPPLNPEDVTIYLAVDDIKGEFERVAIINVSGDATMTNERQLNEAARKEAAKLGANGILFEGIDEPSSGAKVAAAFLGTTTSRRGQMIAIYVHH